MARNKDEEIPANNWGELRSWCARNGFSQAQIDEAIGDDRKGQKRGEVAERLREWILNNAIQ